MTALFQVKASIKPTGLTNKSIRTPIGRNAALQRRNAAVISRPMPASTPKFKITTNTKQKVSWIKPVKTEKGLSKEQNQTFKLPK